MEAGGGTFSHLETKAHKCRNNLTEWPAWQSSGRRAVTGCLQADRLQDQRSLQPRRLQGSAHAPDGLESIPRPNGAVRAN